MQEVLSGRQRVEQLLLSQLTKSEVQQMAKSYAQPFRELMAYYRCAMMEVETKFNVLNEELSLMYDRNPIESVKSRLKSPESIVDKAIRKGIPFSAESIEENLSDIAGVRVICSFAGDIYMLADALLRQDDVTLVARKDYIKEPKENGYRSLHLIVEIPIFLHNRTRRMKVEVQLRTMAMDWWASLEHKIRYKKNLADDGHIAEELLHCAEMGAALDQRMESVYRETAGAEDGAGGDAPC